MRWTYTINGEPASKKNSNRIVRINGVPRVLPNKGYEAYRDRAKVCLQERQTDRPIFFPVRIIVDYYRSNKRRVDKTNLESAVCDVLVECGILADDCRDIAYEIHGYVGYDKENPRTVIGIEPMPEALYDVWNRQFREAGRIQLEDYGLLKE